MINDQILSDVRQAIGVKTRRCIGEAAVLTIQRYARAIDDPNPVYFDEEYARSLGYDGIIAPPNFLTSVMDWGPGPQLGDLRADGSPPEIATGVPRQGVRLMGGGEEMELHAPLVAGTEVYLTSYLVSVAPHKGKSGDLAVLTFHDRYETRDAVPLLTCTRVMLLR